MRGVLDFGCGSGRVLRNWKGLFDGTLHATDYNPELIEWCRKALPFASYNVNNLEPPLAYDDKTFEFVYLLSIFTHLTENLQKAWLADLRRVLKPGGMIYLTTHGKKFVQTLSPGEREAFLNGELVVRTSERAGENACGTYHPESYFRSQIPDGFTIVDFVAEGAVGNGGQDAWLLRKV